MRHALLLFCLIGVVCCGGWAQRAELTTWQLETDSLPGELHWVDGDSLFVALQNPLGIAQFEPLSGRLSVWDTGVGPAEFEVIDGRVLLARLFRSEMAWLNLEYGMLSFFPMPQPNAWPVRLVYGGAAPGETDVWYADWNTGRVGLFAPIESGPADVRGLTPARQSALHTVTFVDALTRQVTGTYYPYNPQLVPAIHTVMPTVTAPFTEWWLFTPSAPAIGFARSEDGRIWLTGGRGDPLQALSPWDNTVTTYELPGAPWAVSLEPGHAGEMCYLAQAVDGTYQLGVLEAGNGDVSLWIIPEAIDPTGLRVSGDEIWFVDRGSSAIYRFVPETSTFAWWRTGADDGPLYLEPGDAGEWWVSLERKGALLRLRLP